MCAAILLRCLVTRVFHLALTRTKMCDKACIDEGFFETLHRFLHQMMRVRKKCQRANNVGLGADRKKGSAAGSGSWRRGRQAAAGNLAADPTGRQRTAGPAVSTADRLPTACRRAADWVTGKDVWDCRLLPTAADSLPTAADLLPTAADPS